MKKFLKFLLILILILVILIAVPVGYLFLSDFNYDAPYTSGLDRPMTSGERFSFSPAEDEMELRLDKSDLYWYVARKMGGDDLYASLNDAISYPDLTLEKAGVEIEQDGIFVCARLLWKGLIPIPVGCKAEVRQEGDFLTAEVRSVQLGRRISIPFEKIERFVPEKPSFSMNLSEEHPFFALSRSATTEDGAIVLSCQKPEAWLLEKIDPELSSFTIMLDYVEPEDIHPMLMPMLRHAEGDSTGIDAAFRGFSSDPAGFEEFLKNYLAMAGAYAAGEFFRLGDWNDRFFQTLTREAVQEQRTAILAAGQAIYDARMAQVAAMELQTLGFVADGTLRVSGGGYCCADGREFTIDALDDCAGLEDWMDMTTLRLVQAVNPGDYLQLMVGKGNKTPVFIARTYTGRPVVFFQYTARQFRVQSLAEEEYLRCMQSADMPTVDLGMHTTQ